MSCAVLVDPYLGLLKQALVQLQVQYRMNADIQLLSNTLVYNHALSCGNDEVANGVLALTPPAPHAPGAVPAWLAHALLPSTTVTFLNTDPMSQAAMENGKRVQPSRIGGVLMLSDVFL